MRSYLLLFTISFVLTLCLTPFVRRWATAWGAVDHPDHQRRIHLRPTPRLGGLAIYFAMLATLCIVPLLNNLASSSLRANWSGMVALQSAATLVLLLGIYDDFRGSNAPTKLLVQLFAAAILYESGFYIDQLSLPLGGALKLPALASFPLTALWVVGITNAFNLIDGIDGLAAGASGFALLTLFICSLTQGHPEISLLSLILVGAVLGFLRYNFNPATIFLGDSGSLLLGFMVAALSLASTQKGTTLVATALPLVAFGLPITEVGLSILRRLIAGAPIFQSDRRHIHHVLLQRGLTQRQVVILLYAVCALFSLFGLMLLNPQRNTVALIFFVLGVGLVLGVRQLGYREFDTLGRHLQRRIKLRRLPTARARWQEGLANLRAAQTTEELVTVLAALCESQGFAAMRLEVWHYSLAASDAISFNGHPAQTMFRAWRWQWPTGEKFEEETELTSNCWSLRFSLVNGEKQSIGAATLFHRLVNDRTDDKIAPDLAHVCKLLSAELSAALIALHPQTAMTRCPQISNDYAPGTLAAVSDG